MHCFHESTITPLIQKLPPENIYRCSAFPPSMFHLALLPRPSAIRLNNGVVEPEAIIRVIFGLETAKPLQPPRLMPVPLFQRLEPVRIVHIRIRKAIRLPAVPLVHDLVRPTPRRVHETRARVRREHGAEVDEEVVRAERVGGGVGVDGRDGRGGVAFVDDDAAGGEHGVGGDALFEGVEDLLLGGHVVDLEAGGRDGSDGVFGFAEEALLASALDDGDFRVGDIALGVPDGVDGVEWSQKFFGFLGGSTIGEGPSDAWFCRGDASVDIELTEIESHVDGSGTIIVESIESSEDGFQILPTPQIVMVVPSVWATGVDAQLEACDDAEVVARTLQPPQEIAVAATVDTNGSAVGQNEIDLPDVVADHAVKTFMASVATPKAGTHHADAVARTGRGNVAFVPKVL